MVTCGRDSTLSRGPREQKPGQADPRRSLGGFLKPFLGAGVDRNSYRAAGKTADAISMKTDVYSSCALLFLTQQLDCILVPIACYGTFNEASNSFYGKSYPVIHLHVLVLGWFLYRDAVLDADEEI